MIQEIKSSLKEYVYRKYGYNLGLLKQRLEKDFLDQQNLLNGIDVKTIIDAGANAGQTTLKYKKLFPESNIYGFEPFPESFEKFKNAYQHDKFVTTEQIALAEENGESLLNVNSAVCTNSLLASSDRESNPGQYNHEQVKTERQVAVKTMTLDKYCQEKNITNIDILKMDVQGGELKILQGAQNLLQGNNISIIFSEIEFVKLYQDQPLFSDICRYLDQYGYSLYNIYNTSNAPDGQLVSGDAIFINKKIREKL